MNAPTHFDCRNVNALWCSVLAETLAVAKWGKG